MNKKDFWILLSCDIAVVVLLIEYLCGLELALECMCLCTIVSLITHIGILRHYVNKPVFVRKDCTKR